MDKQKKQVIAIVAIFAIIGVVMVYQFMNISKPGTVNVEKSDEKIGNYEQQLSKAEMMVKRLGAHRKIVEEKQNILDEYMKEIPLESDDTWLSRQINIVQRGTGVSVVRQRFREDLSAGISDQELGKKYAQRSRVIRLLCGYHELGNFLNRLEESNRFLEIVDINIDGNEPKGQKIEILIRYLVRKQEGD